MDQPDAIVHQPVRLKIMAALKVLPEHEPLEFVRLKAIVGATEGNLGAHIATLEQAGYVAVDKDFVGKKPRTRVRATRVGRRAFEAHIAHLRDIVEAGGGGVSGGSCGAGSSPATRRRIWAYFSVPARSLNSSRQCRSAAASL